MENRYYLKSVRGEIVLECGRYIYNFLGKQFFNQGGDIVGKAPSTKEWQRNPHQYVGCNFYIIDGRMFKGN